MERCGFFDANLVGEEYDRVYLASQFAAYFASFIGNGVFAKHSNQLQVVEMETPQMQVGVERGQAWINGYWYENTDILYLPIDVADGVLDRIDSVVLRLKLSERNIWLDVKKGTPAINPVAPEVTRDTDCYELQLATISIPAGSTKITQAQITDTRMNQEVCGWVTGVVDQIDTETLFKQLEAGFNAWFANVKTTLDGDVAGNLLNLINNHKDDKNNPHEVTAAAIGAATISDISNAINAHDSDSGAHSAQFDAMHTAITQYVDSKTLIFNVTLDTSWSGSAAPYSKSVTVTGILETDTPIIDVVMSGTYATDKARQEAWAHIYRAVTSNNSITFYANEKPTAELPVQIKVVR